MTPGQHHVGVMQTPLAAHQRACQVQSGMPGSKVLCQGMRQSTWQMTAASCPTALGALYGQLTL